MFFVRREVKGLAIYSYVVGDKTTKECVVIDPVRDIEDYIAMAKGFTIKHILETHVHADFVSGAKQLKATLNNTPKIHCSKEGGNRWLAKYADLPLKNADTISIGALTFKAIHTPGHTPEHLMFALFEKDQLKKLFTGDFLFVGSLGRPDLLGETEVATLANQLYNSVFTTLKHFSDEVEIHPAHGHGSFCGKALAKKASSTLGDERKQNPYLQKRKKEEWIAALLSDMPAVPTYFQRMKRINVDGPKILGKASMAGKWLTVSEFKKIKNANTTIVDLRDRVVFAASHIPGSINIALSPALSTWAGWCLPYDRPLALVLEKSQPQEPVYAALQRVGFDKILGTLDGGISQWIEKGEKVQSLHTLSTNELRDLLAKDSNTCVLDVRTKREWDHGHIDRAWHIPAGQIYDQMDRLPKNKPIAVICDSGYRASIVASILQGAGFESATLVLGGMSSWKES